MADSTPIGFISGGDQVQGHLLRASVSPRAAPPPGLVLIPDVRGVSDHFISVAERFAQSGFTTLVVDLYSREGPPVIQDVADALEWMRKLPDRRVLDDIAAAGRHLAGLPDTSPRTGITGFCMGGQYSLMSACAHDVFDACVSWYGMLRYGEKTEHKPASPLDMAANLTCPYLGLFGEQDELIPITDVEELRGILSGAGKDFEIRTYADAGHAFFNDSRPDAYRPAAAADAWPRAVAFLQRSLAVA